MEQHNLFKFKVIYLIVAAIFVVLEGLLYDKWHGIEKRGSLIEQIKQTLINTLGSVIGWLAGYYIIFYRLENGFSGFKPQISDLIVFLIMFYGVVGQLPNVIINKLKLGK
jgi:hypothetical protein